jgi:hypothetical protein
MKPRYFPTTETNEKLGEIEMKLEDIKKLDVVKIRFELSLGLGPGGVEEVKIAFDLQLWLSMYQG